MKSFDVFDTLIARRYIDNTPVLDRIATAFNVPTFTLLRKVADNGTRSLIEIYQNLVGTNAIAEAQAQPMMAAEIELELQNIFPIQSNLDKVSDGDLLITDMYLPGYVILQMVRSVGLTKQVTIYQSNAGKSSGAVWNMLKQSPIIEHLGDHPQSDYAIPASVGINAVLSPSTGITQIENHLVTNGLSNLALLCREVRLRLSTCAYREFFDVANQLNLPWLFLVAEMIHRKYASNNLIFLGRDGQLLHKIYTEYYTTSFYLPFSRKIAFATPEIAVEYLRAHSSPDSKFIDLNSTGNTWSHLAKFGKIDFTAVIYSDVDYYTSVKPILPDTFSWLTTKSEIGSANYHYTEIMNCGNHGHIASVSKLGDRMFTATYGEHEIDQPMVESIHLPIITAGLLAKSYKLGIRAEIAKLSDLQIKQLFTQITISICNQPQLNKHLALVFNKERLYSKDFVI